MSLILFVTMRFVCTAMMKYVKAYKLLIGLALLAVKMCIRDRNTSFDWNGIREAFTFATENDTLNCTSMPVSYTHLDVYKRQIQDLEL